MTQPEITAHAVQAEAEGVDLGDNAEPTIEFKGQRFRTAERVNLMAVMRLALVAKRGTDANDIDGLVALHGVLKTCIAAEDWDRFEQHAMDTFADGDELMKAYQDSIEKISARPTQRSSDSLPGPQITSPNSKQIPPSLALQAEDLAQVVPLTDLLQARSTG